MSPEADSASPSATPADPATPPSRHRLRTVAGSVLLVVATLLVPVSVLGVWVRNQLLDTDRYVETVTPLAADPAVQDAVTESVTEALYGSVDVESKVAEALPDQGAFLAAPISLGIENLIDQVVGRLVRSDQFATLWVDANRTAHDGVVAILTDSGDRKGTVTVDLSGVAAAAQDQLSKLGVDLFQGERAAPQLQLFQSEELARLQSTVSLFDRLATVLPWVTIGLLVAAALVFVDHRRGVMAAFAGLTVGALLLVVGFAVGRWFYLQALPVGTSLSAAEAVFDLLTRFVRGAVRALAAVGLVGVLAALLAGPSRPAVALRRLVGAGVARTGDAAADHGAHLGAFGEFLRSYVVGIRVAVVAVAVIILLVGEQPSAGAVLWTAAITLVVLVVVELLHRTALAEAARSTEDAPESSTSAT